MESEESKRTSKSRFASKVGVPYSLNDEVGRKLKPETQEFENSKNLEYHFKSSTSFMLFI
jgi:hypothetical protein